MRMRGNRTRRRAGVFFVLIVAVALAGCANTSGFKRVGELARPAGTASVLLMPTDIELSELTAAGLYEPKAEWSEAATRYATAAIGEFLAQRDARLIAYTAPADGSPAAHAQTQLIKLHGVVGASILLHKYVDRLKLPTMKGRFDWSLGEGARRLGADSGADYALFVYIRDSYASSGRVAAIFAAAFLGVGVRGGTQLGFASLVDLGSGDIVWFNRLISSSGDLRKPVPARAAVANLLNDFPL
ncbi:MAG: hypothetical protein ACE5H8_14335 [Alphaproteobacteria bacterium]